MGLVPLLSPALLAVLIACAVAAAGVALNSSRRDATFAGFEAITADCKRLRRKLNGVLRREGGDIAIQGEWRNLPLTIRFSHRDDAPGIHLRMAARATFALEITPAGRITNSKRPAVRIPELRLEPRFVLRSDSAAEARLLAGSENVAEIIQTICHSSGVSVLIERGAAEVAESALPSHYVAKRVLRQIKAMADLARAFEAMPNSDLIRVPKVRKQRSLMARAAMVAGVVAAVGAVASASYESEWQPVPALQAHAPLGIPVADAMHISGLWRWKLAAENDFDRTAVAWLRDHNQAATAKINLDLSGNGLPGVAYVLHQPNSFRIVMLDNSEPKYDVTYSEVAAVVRIRAQALSEIEWASAPVSQPDGDGLLLVMRADDPASGVVLYSHGGRVFSAAPADYQRIPLE